MCVCEFNMSASDGFNIVRVDCVFSLSLITHTHTYKMNKSRLDNTIAQYSILNFNHD